jgi:hypothetical protein
MRARQEQEALTHNKYIEIESSILNLIVNSQHIAKGTSTPWFKSCCSDPGQSTVHAQCQHQEAPWPPVSQLV